MKRRSDPEAVGGSPVSGGTQGRSAPFRIHPFTFGLVGALGVLVALLIGSVVGQLSTVLVYIGLALFLALGLDPIVSFIERKLPRGAAISIVVAVVVLAFAGIILAIVPVLVQQITHLSLIHISEPTRLNGESRFPACA